MSFEDVAVLRSIPDMVIFEPVDAEQLRQALPQIVKCEKPCYIRMFRKETGISIVNYIQKERIEAACNMLVYSEYTASQIGEYLCFSNQSYFIRIFKKFTGNDFLRAFKKCEGSRTIAYYPANTFQTNGVI